MVELEADTNWVKQTNFTFAACVAYLKSRIDSQDDPATLVLQYRLFKALGDEKALIKIRSKIEEYVNNLVDLQDSGFQMRDCLVVATYANLNNWQVDSRKKFESIVLPRLQIAASSNWFDEPELVSSVLSIQDYDDTLLVKASDYFEKNVDFWLKKGFLKGILFYAFNFSSNEKAKTFLEGVEWGSQNLGIISLALLFFSSSPQPNSHTQETLSKLIYACLEHNKTLGDFINTVQGLNRQEHPLYDNSSLTDYEIAFALLAIKEANHQEIIGFRGYQTTYLASLQKMQKVAEDGGLYISRFQTGVYELAILASVFFTINFLLRLEYFQDWVSPLVELAVQGIPLGILLVLRRKRLAPLIENWIKYPGDT